MREIRIGDRYERILPSSDMIGSIWEVIDDHKYLGDTFLAICITNSFLFKVGDKESWGFKSHTHGNT